MSGAVVDELDEDDPILLPPPTERTWILEQMAELVRRAGYEHLVLAPLLEPTERFFPDPWAGGEASLRRLLRRLAIYADLDVSIAIKVHEDADVGGPTEPAGPGSQIWLVRKSGDTLHFAARASALRDPMQVVPAAARAMAEGWRACHGLTLGDLGREQRCVDLTTVHLGFGVLTTDASLRHSATRSGGFRLQRTTTKLGVIGPRALAFALAAQADVRGLDRAARRAIMRRLQPNQAGFFAAAANRLAHHDPPLAEVLGLPSRSTWPPPPDLDDLTAALPDEAEDDGAQAAQPEERKDEDRGVLGINAGRPVFRVERTKATRLAKALGLPAVLIGVLLNRMQMGIEIEMWQAGVVGAALALLGLLVGRFIDDIRCSEPKCATPLTRDMTACPRCKGTIAGVIHHPKERLAAEDALEARPHGGDVKAEQP